MLFNQNKIIRHINTIKPDSSAIGRALGKLQSVEFSSQLYGATVPETNSNATSDIGQSNCTLASGRICISRDSV